MLCINVTAAAYFSLFTFHFSFNNAVIFVRENDTWLKSLCLFKIHPAVADDDENITNLYTAGGSAIEANHTRAPFASDDVGFEAFAIVVVDDLDSLPFDEVGGIHEVFVDGNAPDVVQVGLGDLYPVNFRFKSLNQHRLQS